MGRDIHMNIVNQEGITLYSEIYDGRNYDWFNNLMGSGLDFEYDDFPVEYGVPPFITCGQIKNDSETEYCYSFRYIKIQDFIDWYNKHLPHLKAGYVSEYDNWKIKKKHYVPEYLQIFPDEEQKIFVEYEDHLDGSYWLKQFLETHEDITNSHYIVYYFDC